jgi:hypothetical protein
MSLSVVSITLNIRNNRTYPQRINVLGSPVNPLDTANALTEYRWDITAFTPSSSDTLTLEYKPLGASVFSTYTYLLSNPNSEALVAALNGLGIGYFNYYTELGQNYLSTNNDDYVFGNLTINSNVPVTPTTSTTTTTTTAAPTTTSTTTTTTTAAPTTTSTTTTTTTAAPTTTSTTSTTTTAAPTTTSTTSTTTTAAPTTTSTTSTTTTAAPTTTTSTTTTTTTLSAYTYALGVDSISGNGACLDFTIAPINYYSSSIGLNNGVVLYQDFALSVVVPDNYYSDGVQNWLITGGNGILTLETLCSLTTSTTTTTTTAAPTTTSTTTTTTTAAPTTTSTTTTTTTAAFVSFSLGYSVVDGNTACATGAGTYYASSGSTLQNGTIIYTDSALTTPAPVGYYSDGLNWWFISGGGLAGELSSETLCGSTTTSTTTTTTTAASTTTTSTTSTTTTATPTCNNYNIEGAPSIDVQWLECDGTPNSATVTTAILVCAQTGSVSQTGGAGNITQLGSCTSPTTTSTTTTTTTAAFETFTLAYSNIDGATACSDYPTLNTSNYYATSGSLLQTGTIIYTDTALTNPAANGFYSNGVNYWNTGAGSGNLQNQTSCNPTTTSTTTTTTTVATTTSTTSTTTTLFQNLFFDLTTGVGGYTIGSIDVNGITPTLTSGTNVPFNTDSHGFNTTQVGTNETLNIFVSALSLNGCITVTDSASNVFQQNINATGTYSFAGLTIDNITTVNVLCADNVC